MKFEIKEPYWSAWKKYGWPKFTWAVGLNKNDVNGNKEPAIIVETRGEQYAVDPKEVKESPTQTARGTELYIVSSKKLRKLKKCSNNINT